MKKLFFLVSILPLISSCSYDSEEVLYGLCDTEVISYADIIEPIIQTNCNSGCHFGENPTGALSLDSYEAVKSNAENAGYNGLINRIERTSGSEAMPPSGRLTQCQIDQIIAWVAQGALNN